MQLSSTVSIKKVSEDAQHGVFEIAGLYSGYGLTVGNALRRALLSSLPGAAVTQIKVKNAPHEFTTLPGLKEDLVELMLNFKLLRFRMHTDEPQVLTLVAKGEGAVTAEQIKSNSLVEIVNPKLVLATLTAKAAELNVEITVERGMGYVASETRMGSDKLPVGAIAVDAFFSPVTVVNYTVEDMRVGEHTDYNRVMLELTTDGTVSPSSAINHAATVLREHFEIVAGLDVTEVPAAAAPAKKSAKK